MENGSPTTCLSLFYLIVKIDAANKIFAFLALDCCWPGSNLSEKSIGFVPGNSFEFDFLPR